MAVPIRVHGGNRRSDNDAFEGGFVKAVSGVNAGVIGVLHETKTFNTGGDGYPLTAVVVEAKTGRWFGMTYSDLRPVSATDQVRA